MVDHNRLKNKTLDKALEQGIINYLNIERNQNEKIAIK